MTNSQKIMPEKTQAETELLAQFAALRQSRAFKEIGEGWLPSMKQREAALAELAQGLPTRKAESWHYTDLRRHLTHIAPFNAKAGGAALPPLLDGAHILSLINGRAEAAQAINAEGIYAAPLAVSQSGNAALAGQAAIPAAEKETGAADIVGAVNAAFIRDGWQIDIEKSGGSAMRVIELQNIQNGGQSHTGFAVNIGAGARATFIERQCGNDEDSFLSSVSEMRIGAGAELHWVILRERGLSAAELNLFRAVLAEEAKLTLYIVNAGGHFLRQEVKVDLAGEGANFQLRGINLLAGESHTDVTMSVRHLAENTASTEIFRNVVMEKARGVFQGMIKVAQAAQKTDARMACNSLILSDEAEFDAKPELEIFADDVACGHGATVREISREHLFYLMARGIPEAEARALLVKAFVNELIDELPEGLAQNLHQAVNLWLERHFKA